MERVEEDSRTEPVYRSLSENVYIEGNSDGSLTIVDRRGIPGTECSHGIKRTYIEIRLTNEEVQALIQSDIL